MSSCSDTDIELNLVLAKAEMTTLEREKHEKFGNWMLQPKHQTFTLT